MCTVSNDGQKELVNKAIEAAVANIEKAHGKGSIVRLGSTAVANVPVIPTGIFEIDYKLLGVGGFPRGRIVEIFGAESSAKTTLALQVVASAQKMGLYVAYVDTEHSLDVAWSAKNGVDVDNLYLSQPDTAEEALQIVEELAHSGGFSVIVIDSIAALVPRVELEGEVGDANVAVVARLMSQSLRKFVGLLSKTNTLLICLNQMRSLIGVQWGPTTTTSGGRSLRFFASIRLEMSKGATIKVGDTPVGTKIKVKAVKNKMSAPFKTTEIDLMFDTGLDAAGSVLTAAIEAGVVKQAGSWFSYEDIKLGQGKSAALAKLVQENLMEQILKETLCKI